MDASSILPESAVYRAQGGRLTSFSNYFRWELLRRKGGIWTDLDVVCLRPFDFADDVIFGLEDENGQIGTALIGFPEGHPLPAIVGRACANVNAYQPIDTIKSLVKKTARKLVYGEAVSRTKLRFTEPGGPAYVTKFADFYGYSSLAKPVEWFYPLAYPKWRSAFAEDGSFPGIPDTSYCIHLWNKILSSDPNFDKSNVPTGSSYFSRLLSRYGVQG